MLADIICKIEEQISNSVKKVNRWYKLLTKNFGIARRLPGHESCRGEGDRLIRSGSSRTKAIAVCPCRCRPHVRAVRPCLWPTGMAAGTAEILGLDMRWVPLNILDFNTELCSFYTWHREYRFFVERLCEHIKWRDVHIFFNILNYL
jgi:hypothetical protein